MSKHDKTSSKSPFCRPQSLLRSHWSMPKWWIFMNLPRAWMHSKMVIKQRRMETKPHRDSEMEEWRVSDWMVNAPLGYIPGSTGISRSVASLPSTLHASSTAEIMWNAGCMDAQPQKLIKKTRLHRVFSPMQLLVKAFNK